MKVITYTIELLEPVLVSDLDGDPNSAVACDYLPGSALRGAVIAAWRQRHRAFDAADSSVRRLFFEPTTRYLNGSLLDADNCRSLPVPRCWQRPKGEHDAPIRDLRVAPVRPDDRRIWQSAGAPYWSPVDDEGEDIRLLSPDYQLAVHTQRHRGYGRAMKELGAVYRYQALAAGQRFGAVVLCDTDEDADGLLGLLQGDALLGGSRSGGYGRVRFTDVREADPDWRELGDEPPEVADTLVLYLTSDALVRDQLGQHSTAPEAVGAAVSRCVGVPVSLDGSGHFVGQRVTGGFNRRWGLPLPQVAAVARGSVYLLQAPQADQAALDRLERQGIGERRSEGFGRVLVNRLKLASREVTEAGRQSRERQTVQLTGRTVQQAESMLQRLLLRRLDERLGAAVRRHRISRPPPPSQLARIRSVIRTESLSEANLVPLQDFLIQVKGRNRTKRQFDDAKVNGSEKLMKWLENVLGSVDRNEEWCALFGFEERDLPVLGTAQAVLDEPLRRRYLLRLVDGVLAQAAETARRTES